MSEHYDEDGDSEWACGGDSDCPSVEEEPDCAEGFDHKWTAEGMGGCDQNPGVRSLGGTTLIFAHKCVVCGVERIETHFGSQRNPGQCDEVVYDAGNCRIDPKSWLHPGVLPLDTNEARKEIRRQRRNRAQRKRRALKRATKLICSTCGCVRTMTEDAGRLRCSVCHVLVATRDGVKP